MSTWAERLRGRRAGHHSTHVRVAVVGHVRDRPLPHVIRERVRERGGDSRGPALELHGQQTAHDGLATPARAHLFLGEVRDHRDPRRRRLVTITDAGREPATTLTPAVVGIGEEMPTHFDPVERDQFLSLMRWAIEAVNRQTRDAPAVPSVG
ncbi:hypothetical protein [Streptomyces sp. NPDC056689]|uniref:hypothetical protein n=1 Tax=unclassified Streptomyces TaxID=2593676 RepID=UPI0036382CD7